jgi:hypothetical protein
MRNDISEKEERILEMMQERRHLPSIRIMSCSV